VTSAGILKQSTHESPGAGGDDLVDGPRRDGDDERDGDGGRRL
jgi:hypothetical protein